MKWADGKQADPNHDPEAHVVEKTPSLAKLFQQFREANYNKFFFDLVCEIYLYKEEDKSPK
jgi:hypothetical protein